MFEFKTETNHISYVKRNKNIIIFYKSLNIYSYLSAFVLYSYFQKHGMIENCKFIPTYGNNCLKYNIKENYELFNSSHIFFLDCDIDYKTLRHYVLFCESITVIDSKESTSIIKQDIASSILTEKNKYKINFVGSLKDNKSPIFITWYLLSNDDYPEYFCLLDEEYSNLLYPKSDYDLYIKNACGKNFEQVRDFIEKQTYTKLINLDDSTIVLNYQTEQALRTTYKNSKALIVNGHKAISINCSLNESDFVRYVTLSKRDVDICVCYEQRENICFYSISTYKPTIDLLKMFNKVRPAGYKNHIWFESKKNLFSL
jgi:hypothetical protein